MTEPTEDADQLEQERLAAQSGGYGGPGVEAEETPEQRAADREAADAEDEAGN
jgi:hypothetical protein